MADCSLGKDSVRNRPRMNNIASESREHGAVCALAALLRQGSTEIPLYLPRLPRISPPSRVSPPSAGGPCEAPMSGDSARPTGVGDLLRRGPLRWPRCDGFSGGTLADAIRRRRPGVTRRDGWRSRVNSAPCRRHKLQSGKATNASKQSWPCRKARTAFARSWNRLPSRWRSRGRAIRAQWSERFEPILHAR
jgi:hypothetical protein